MSPIQTLRSLTFAAFAVAMLPGCFIFGDDVDDDDDYEPPPPVVNYQPEFVSSETWWLCDYDPESDD